VIYHRPIQIEFNHCDPAGIVFYPRYFEMINSVAENFFKDVAGRSYASMIATRQGVPTARLETNFHIPSRLGETLDFRLKVTRLGTSSITFEITAYGPDGNRLTASITLVWVSPEARPLPWPEDMRVKLTAFMEAAE
jgi:4-hydroxybenzoyl-CoA thioesterase